MQKIDFSTLPNRSFGVKDINYKYVEKNEIPTSFFIFIVIVSSFLSFIGLLLFIIILSSSVKMLLFIPVLMILAGPGIFIYLVFLRQKRSTTVHQIDSFISKNKFSDTLTLRPAIDAEPFVYGIGTKRTKSLQFSGTLNELKFDVFCYKYSIESRRSETKFPFTIFHFQIDKELPHIVLDSHKNDGIVSSIPVFFDDDQRIELEGNFNEYFDLYAPDGYSIEALDILSPDFMQTLIDFSSNFDIEIDSNEVYIISAGVKYDQQSMSEMFKAAEILIDRIKRKLDVWSMVAMERKLPELRYSKNESAIRVGNKRISTEFIIIPIVSAVIVFKIIGEFFQFDINPLIPIGLFLGLIVIFIYSRSKNKKSS